MVAMRGFEMWEASRANSNLGTPLQPARRTDGLRKKSSISVNTIDHIEQPLSPPNPTLRKVITKMTDAQAAQLRWELENGIEGAESADIDSLYRWDPDATRAIQNEKPWTKDPNYFKQ
jgi:hypothetical protein